MVAKSLPLAVKALCEAGLGEEGLFQLLQLTTEEITGLVDEADEGVGGDFGGGRGDAAGIGRVGPVGQSLLSCLFLCHAVAFFAVGAVAGRADAIAVGVEFEA
jgi:hypothetical protein